CALQKKLFGLAVDASLKTTETLAGGCPEVGARRQTIGALSLARVAVRSTSHPAELSERRRQLPFKKYRKINACLRRSERTPRHRRVCRIRAQPGHHARNAGSRAGEFVVSKFQRLIFQDASNERNVDEAALFFQYPCRAPPALLCGPLFRRIRRK